MAILVLLAGSLLVALGLLVALDALFLPAAARRASFRRVAAYASHRESAQTPQVERPKLGELIVPALGRVGARLTPRAQRDQLELRLEAAGATPRLDAQRFLALKTVLVAVSLAVVFGVAGIGLLGFLLALLFVVASLYLPDRVLVRVGNSRAERLTAHLPEVIDQIAISLEAGLAFDAAVSYFVRKGRSPLVAELRVMMGEIRMGASRVQAFKHLSERVPSDEMRNFVQTLVQSEGVGLSRAAMLRTQATDLRLRRQLAAEERAQKVPVKILFPTVVFFLPVLFVVILGPALQQISRLLAH